MSRIAIVLILLSSPAFSADWPQGPGPRFDFTSAESAVPSRWSVALGENVVWRRTLPETGQSSPIVVGSRLFVTTMRPVESEAKTGSAIVLWCLSAKDGSVLWQRDVPGRYATKLSGPFGDASSPAPVSDGSHVWVLNPTGRIACFDVEGDEVWSRPVTSVVRTRPVLFDGKLLLHDQVYLPDDSGTFSGKKAGADDWTQLQALDAKSGKPVWRTKCGVNMGCVPLVQTLADGTAVMVVGRGGGHGPPERPDGISMIRLDDGSTMWTLELPNYMSTQTYPVVDGSVLVFHRGEHLWVDAASGRITRRVSITNGVPVRRWKPKGRATVVETLPEKKPRSITQQSNLRVGRYHYFRSYTRNYLGRVDVKSGDVEYLELPLQVLREKGEPERSLWTAGSEVGGTKEAGTNDLAATLHENRVTNSRGLLVMGDRRAVRNGWGHTASPLPTAFGNRLFVPILSGTVFVIRADAAALNEEAVLAVSDLGPLGESFTRSSITTDGEHAFAHTIREIVCIGAPDDAP